jgi:phosphoribosylglycinamide formyltransferase-1
MKIGVFAYNFKHKKTQEGLLHLFLNNINVDCIFAADPVELKFYQSKIRISPRGLMYIHPSQIAKRLDIPYYVVAHNDNECSDLIKKHNLDLGIILGARILKENIIDSFNLGVLNLHPGLLPENRGLDNQKWAILKEIKQGVTAHLIDKYIDKGKVILRKEVDVYEDDSLVDIFLRIQNTELDLMIDAINMLSAGKFDSIDVNSEFSFKAVSQEEEEGLLDLFEKYKKKYKYI